jgi:hypothetical protein
MEVPICWVTSIGFSKPTKVRHKLTKKLISVGFCLTSIGLWPTEVPIFIVVVLAHEAWRGE